MNNESFSTNALTKFWGFLIAMVFHAAIAYGFEEVSISIPRLLEQLDSSDSVVKEQAMLELLGHDNLAQAAFPILIQRLVDDETLDAKIASRVLYLKTRTAGDVEQLVADLELDTQVRVPAAWGLSRIGLSASESAGAALVAALKYPDKHERNFVAVACMTTVIPSKESILVLIDILRDEGSDRSAQLNYKYPRAAAAIALGLIGSESKEALPDLLRFLDEHDPWECQRAAACYALGGIGEDSAQPMLIRALRDESPLVQTHAAIALDRLNAAIEINYDVVALTRTLSSNPSRVNSKVLRGLRKLGTVVGNDQPIRRKGADRSSGRVALPVHESISLALGYIDSLEIPPTPRGNSQPLNRSKMDSSTRTYLMALGGVQQGIAATLLESLAQSERDPRMLAIRSLGKLVPTAMQALPSLKSAVEDPDWIVRREAFFSIRRVDAAVSKPH
ncbi:MAG: HEAT repeat domain-containing protein [Pirellulaceae bacterium]|nr:HEAT repeat domain-containing protein [Pirellulaceae bacterium]